MKKGDYMSTASQTKRKVKVINPASARFARMDLSDEEVRNRQRSVREFISAMSAELAILAYENRLESLAVIFDMAREAADESAAGATERPKTC
jgi:hypothetical protein